MDYCQSTILLILLLLDLLLNVVVVTVVACKIKDWIKMIKE